MGWDEKDLTLISRFGIESACTVHLEPHHCSGTYLAVWSASSSGPVKVARIGMFWPDGSRHPVPVDSGLVTLQLDIYAFRCPWWDSVLRVARWGLRISSTRLEKAMWSQMSLMRQYPRTVARWGLRITGTRLEKATWSNSGELGWSYSQVATGSNTSSAFNYYLWPWES